MAEDVSILSGKRGKHYGTVGESMRSRDPCRSHYIVPGDTLVSIAVRYGTTVQHLKLLNHLWTTDISNLKTLKVPLDSSPGTSSELGDIELTSVKPKPFVRKDNDCGDVASASVYIKDLFDRVQQAKESACSVLKKSRLPEILTDANLDYSLRSDLRGSSQTAANPAVMVTSSSSSSLNSQWRAPTNKQLSCSTPEAWNSHCEL